MDSEKELREIESSILSLIKNVEESSANTKENDNNVEINDPKISNKYKIKDFVFLAIITATTLVCGAIMPLLINVPLFGIVQLGLGLQFSIFPVIGIMKVRKIGSLFFQSVFISVFLIFMFPPMCLIILCSLISEIVAFIIFHGYKNDWACVVAGTLYMPLTLPLMWVYYNKFYTITGDEKASASMFLGGTNTMVIVAISFAVILICFIGSIIGMLIARELRKGGVLKK